MSRGLLIVRFALLLVVTAATAYALDLWVLVPLRCSHAASVGAAEIDEAGDAAGYTTQRVVRRVGANLQGCDCVTPPDARIFFVRGAAAQGGGDLQTAIADYRRALEIDRRPEIYLHLGFAQLDASDRAAAIENLVRACAFDPSRLGAVDDNLRQEIEQRLRARYGAEWVR